ncbi:hypothetical protein DUI87_11986 [Hirundo rustica rustica]|uniref:Uncharacterized protein n=1 Tax=Hirundo rustica rustica TaxID=333673 RepID=A0A3M0KLM3_HIRRU|nr:hypothetical protein DUI87_11986 [Hirundo rustica rustica]
MAATPGRALPLLLCGRRPAALTAVAGRFPALGRRRQQQRHRTEKLNPTELWPDFELVLDNLRAFLPVSDEDWGYLCCSILQARCLDLSENGFSAWQSNSKSDSFKYYSDK